MQEIIITNQNGESVTLGNQAPFFLEAIDGVGEVGIAIESQKAPKQDGSTYIDNTLGSRAITIEGMIITKGDPCKLQKARRLMQRVVNPKLGEVIITYRKGQQVKEIKAIAESTPVFPAAKGNQGLYYQKFLLYLLCHQPFWLDTFYETRKMSYLMGGIGFRLRLPTAFSYRGFKRMALNDGDVATPVEIEFTGPAINPTVSNLTTGEFITVNRKLEEEDILYISTAFGEKHVKINGENAFHYIELDSTFWQLIPGENLLSYTSNKDSIKTKVLVKWKNRYVGL
ncbi:MAG TPA: phage tail family protein [Tepidanaerobacter syntrophicus]|uniref:phage tail family protein n=1 Tax=Tepidanaerobacter syntrophicus TaxID=224999 RepID=UPI0017734593|nr:phage tail family protein [Tepidanaerobacter syntrophicus]HHV82752.1 phage tail family protein [Tepidanaerobacter syntrophicus]